MGPSTPFIRRPVATTLLTFGLAAAGIVAFFKLPVSPLPDVDIDLTTDALPEQTKAILRGWADVEESWRRIFGGQHRRAPKVPLTPRRL